MKVDSDHIMEQIIAHINPLLPAAKEDAAASLDWEIELCPDEDWHRPEPDVGIMTSWCERSLSKADELQIKRVATFNLVTLGVDKDRNMEIEILTLRITAACEEWLEDYEEEG